MPQVSFLLIVLLALASCNNRNLAYLSDVQGQGEYIEKVTNATEPKIKPGDLLGITVTSLNADANRLFNQGVLIPVGSAGVLNQPTAPQSEGYIVDQEGFIDFPVLGKVQLGGLRKPEAKEKMLGLLEEYLEDPGVNIRYLNYRITVIGEVNRPSTFTIPNEKINILEALGMAGDLTVFGKRENVLIIREEEGERKMTRVNLNDKDVLNSPYFFLQQNDVVYVEPVPEKAAQASLTRSNISIFLSAASILAIIITRFL